jgi:hypothetical protein
MERMNRVQNNGGATGGITGKGFRPGRSGNRGRPMSLAKATRQLVGEDGMKLAEFWLSIMEESSCSVRRRLPGRICSGRDNHGSVGHFLL